MGTRIHSRRATQADIAEKAGVSITTVSLVLSEREEWIRQFHPDTVNRVREAARKLGYRANLFASGLPNKTAPFVALIIRDFVRQEPATWHLWAFEGELLACLVRVGAEVDLHPIVVTADPEGDEEAMQPVQQIIEGGVFGAIIRSPNQVLEKYLRTQIKAGQRIIVLFPDRISCWPTNAITLDNVRAGRIAGELLAAQGRRRWAAVHYHRRRMRESHALRREGFEQVARRVGATVKTVRLPRLIEEVTSDDLAALRRLNADGYFAVDAVLSICALQACIGAGRQVGADFNLVGMNCSRWHNPPLPQITAIEISWRDVGGVAIRELTRESGGGEYRFDSILMKPNVIAGDTCPVSESLSA